MAPQHEPSPINPARAEAPLAAYHGERPEAPAWFARVLAMAPERGLVEVDGAGIETLVWGPKGARGLLLMHGNGAHADWWSFIAPWFAEQYRVVAMSFSGMGGSDWREAYSTEGFVAEAQAVADRMGLFDGVRKPVFIGHSMGAAIALDAAGRFGDRLAAAVLVDPPFRTPERMRQWRERRAERPPQTFPKRFYKDLPTALSRFRLLPAQASEHPYLLDHIARASLRETPEGWTWRFDPALWSKMTFSDLSPVLADPGCPLALIHGDRSRLSDSDDLAHMWAAAPQGTPVVMIPDADHHLMLDQPLAFVAALRGLLAAWPC
jgi:pimeloyl-ACP methyl ester carboxylesterase